MIGLCRFSYIATSNNWAAVSGDVDHKKAFLFSEDRMKIRIDFLKRFLLPSVAAQTDQNFDFVLLVSSLLPEKYLDAVRLITCDLPNVHIVALDPMNMKTACRKAYDQRRESGDDDILFRIDDDDALSIDYVERLKDVASKSSDLADLRVVSFTNGIMADFAREQGTVQFSDYSGRLYSAGLAVLGSRTRGTHPYAFSHHKADEGKLTILVPGAPAFIRSLHAESDSQFKWSSGMWISQEDAREKWHGLFPFL